MAFSLMGILAVMLEFFRAVLMPLGIVAALFLLAVFYLLARRASLRVAPAVRTAAALGVVIAILAASALPGWTGATHGQLSGALDFLALTGASVGLGVAAGVVVYPFLQLAFRKATD